MIPDHPWMDSGDGAAVRIAMTSAAGTSVLGFFAQVVNEVQTDDGELSVNLRSQ